MFKAKMARKPQDKIMRLLSELRESPNEDTLRRITNTVDDARRGRIDYYGVDRAVRKILARELTEKEKNLIKRLG
jgi:hypothetical protein